MKNRLHLKINVSAIVGMLLFSATCHAFFGETVVPAANENSAECKSFIDFATQQVVDPQYISGSNDQLKPFNSDSVMVIKDGKTVYEWYDGVNATPDSSHILWSASKDITGLLIARTIQEGYQYKGKPFSLESHLEEFFPFDELLSQHPNLKTADTERTKALYQKITIDNLIQMAAGFDWKEYYDTDLTSSSFMPMLYTLGRQDMADFALQAPMSKEGPGNIWNYSGGNANILMAILKKIHGDKYETMPWDLLFNPLHMTSARIERDGSGKFIGSSYIFMSTRDMGKVGQLLIQNGNWEGKQLLPPSWTVEAQELDEAVMNPATKLDVIKSLGTESKRIFWLNKNIYREDGTIIEKDTGRKILYPQEMPQVPTDMIFAAGHYGQLIIVIPSQNTVIIRTGADVKYWDHIQPLSAKALACFANYKIPKVDDLTPPSASKKETFLGSVVDFVTETLPDVPSYVEDLVYLKRSGIASAYMAKEMCSYLFASGVASRMKADDWQSQFMTRLGFPGIVDWLIDNDMDIHVDVKKQQVLVGRYVIDGNNSDDRVSSDDHYYLDRFVATLTNDPKNGCDLKQISKQDLNH